MTAPDIEGDYVPGPERLGRQLKSCFQLIVASVAVFVVTLVLLIWIYKSQLTTSRGYAKYGTSHVPRTRATWTAQIADVASRTRCLPFTDEELATNRSTEGYRLQDLVSSMCAVVGPEDAIAAVELGVDVHRCAIAFKKESGCVVALNPVYAPPWYSFPNKAEHVTRNPMCPTATFARSYPAFANIEYREPGGVTASVVVSGTLPVRVLERLALQSGELPCPIK
jgi:hypothetical protein